MDLSTAVPFDLAVARFERKSPIGSAMRTRQWDAVDGAIRDRAFFSAGVEDTRILSDMRDRIGSDLRLDPATAFAGKDAFVADMRKSMGAVGDSDRLTDIRSQRRLELIYDMQRTEALEFGRHEMGQSPALLAAYPARELFRESSRQAPREWRNRWIENGGKTFGGRMIALVNDPIWVAISRFGRPYPPFDFGSGMGMRDIERDEAERLGLIKPDETIAPEPSTFNGGLQAGVSGLWEDRLFRANLKSAFGDQVYFDRGKLIWAGEKLLDLYDDAMLTGSNAKGAFKFGKATATAIAKGTPDLDPMLNGKTLAVSKANLWHAMDRHGPKNLTREGSGETLKSQLPLHRAEFSNLNSLWMQPDEVRLEKAGKPGILFRRNVRGGMLEMVLAPDDGNPELLNPVSIRKKRKVPGP